MNGDEARIQRLETLVNTLLERIAALQARLDAIEKGAGSQAYTQS